MKCKERAVEFTKITGPVDNAYGLQLEVNIEELSSFLASVDAKRKVDIQLTINGEHKEFTFEDFMQKLGFDEV